MYLSLVDIFDLFFRFAVIGQFILLAIFILRKPCDFQSILLTLLITCVCSYLLLTPQIPNHHYGSFRGVLLFFTDIIPYVCWFYVFALLDDEFTPKNWPLAVKASLFCATLWLLYFFVYLQGKGEFHQINHLIEAVATLHILYVALKDLKDDLVDSRRKKRMLIVFAFSVYGLVLIIFELANSNMVQTSTFSLINSALTFTVVNFLLFKALKKYQQKEEVNVLQANVTDQSPLPSPENIPLIFSDSFNKLTAFLDAGHFTQTQLTIKNLANTLQTPEHQLRELINQYLGFKNFSSFLNSYRIPAACRQFENVANIRKPILTIALDLGYGSIGPFNRAFKDFTGKTPSQYRQSTVTSNQQ